MSATMNVVPSASKAHLPRMAQSTFPPVSATQLREWEAEFDAAARRPLRQRFRYAFIKTYKPVLDDAPYRSFESTQAYREWCNANLPSWLGYGSEV